MSSRRDFLKLLGMGAAVAAFFRVAGRELAEFRYGDVPEGEMQNIRAAEGKFWREHESDCNYAAGGEWVVLAPQGFEYRAYFFMDEGSAGDFRRGLPLEEMRFTPSPFRVLRRGG